MKTMSVGLPIALVTLMSFASANIAGAAVTITQAKAKQGAVTPGDAPGFPVTISKPGSYILASNLTVPDGNTTAIVIAADHVTLDLGGYAILGPVDCSGGLNPCAGAGYRSRHPHHERALQHHDQKRHGAGSWPAWHLYHRRLAPRRIHPCAQQRSREESPSKASADDAGSIVQFNTAQRNGDEGSISARGSRGTTWRMSMEARESS